MAKKKRTSSIPVRSTKKTRSSSAFLLSEHKNRANTRALQIEAKKLSSGMLPYKPAKLYTAKGDVTKHWYVEYYYIIPGTQEYKRIKERFDINRISTFNERLLYGQSVVNMLNAKLAAGFNPFEAAKVVADNVEIKIKTQLFQIKNALTDQAPSNYAAASYTENYNRLVKFIEATEIDSKLISDFTLEDAKQFKKFMLTQKLAKKTINSTLSYLSQFWEVAINNKWTKEDPFKLVPRIKRDAPTKDKNKVERFEPLTGEEISKVFGELKTKGEINFIRFLAVIFYAWARPIEIKRLRVQDIELGRQVIRFKKGETKNKNAAYVQIVPPLLKLFKQMQIEKVPGDYFLFSDNFEPGKRQVSKHYALTRWKNLVKDGMGIQKDMYALKHTGNIDYLLKNKGKADLKWQQMQNRHSSSTMTDRYNRSLGVYFIEVGNLNYTLFE